jgi:hypothetical protein
VALVIPQGFAQFAVELTNAADEDPWTVTFGIETDLATEDAVEHCNIVLAAFTAAWRPSIDTSVTIGPARGTFGTDGPDPIQVESTTSPVLGQRSMDALPQNTAVLIRKQTGLGGRKNRGRMYMPALAAKVDVTEVGAISSGPLADFQTAATNFYNLLDTGQSGLVIPTPMVILHAATSVSLGLPAPTPVTSLVVDPIVATQRRRLRR